MKFALFALVASASAIKITTKAADLCVSMQQSNHVFDLIDTNGDNQIDRAEGEKAVKAFFADHPNIHPTGAEVRFAEDATDAAAGADHKLNRQELNNLANTLCAAIESN